MVTRRDFLNGVCVGLTGAAATSGLWRWSKRNPHAPAAALVSGAVGTKQHAGDYPPLRQGIRGQHDGSFDVAHQMAWGGRKDWGSPILTDDTYDLVVVGSGLSGLAAAHFYRKQQPNARILLLDNHDDFGGHARRNEFEVDGRMFLGTGGSQSIVNFDINDPMRELLNDLLVDLDVFENGAFDKGFYSRHGLEQVWYFDKQSYGVDQLVRIAGPLGFNLPFPKDNDITKRVAEMPLSEASKRELLALYTQNGDRTSANIFSEFDYLKRITYEDFLKKHGGVTQTELLQLLSAGISHTGLWGDNASAELAITSGLPGIGRTSLSFLNQNRFDKIARWFLNYVHHFPDGNASMARLLVRELIPEVSNGQRSMKSIVTAPFDYNKLDLASSSVRLRLNSTVIHVEHDGKPKRANQVNVTYVRNGRAERVKTKHCILACQNRIVPHIWHEISPRQAKALSQNFRSPVFYSNVVLRNWSSLKKAKIAGAFSPGCLHTTMIADLPVSLGDYRYSLSPDDPIVLYMGGSTKGSGPANPRVRFKTQRMQLLTMPFETFENDIRRQLEGMLGSFGFDSESDIAAITVNRWSHGFTMSPDLIFGKSDSERTPSHEVGRQTVGRIAIANSDAGALGLQQAAYAQAWRAVEEVMH